MLFRHRWLRKFVRRNMNPIPEAIAEKWYKRLSMLYMFMAWNTLGAVIYMTKTGRFDFAKYYGLKTEQEENRSKAVEAMEMLRIPKARVITVKGFTKVGDEELINEALEEEKRLKDEDDDN